MKEFNMIISGVGGQGVITLMQIIAEAALKQGYDVKTSELHGLAQRGGSVINHIRIGDKIYSPLVMEGEANLIISLEPVEALRAAYYGSKENKTTFLINNYSIIPLSVPVTKEFYPPLEKIKEELKYFSSRIIMINASDIVKKEGASLVLTNIYMLGFASFKNLLPLEKKYLWKGIEEIVPRRYLDVNRKIFESAFKVLKVEETS